MPGLAPRAFRSRPYRRLWLGSLVSNVGTWMELVAVGVYVTRETGRVGWTGTVAALLFVPSVFLGPWAGALADHTDRRRLAILTTGVQTILAATVAILALTGRLSVPVVAVVMFLNGCATTLLHPTVGALITELVSEEELVSALSLSAAQYNLGRALGPALAAGAIAVAGLPGAFVLNALSFLAVLGALASLPAHRRPRPPRSLSSGLGWSGVREGLHFSWHDPGVRAALGLTAVTGVLISPFIGLIPAFALQILGRGASGASFLVTAQGLGAVAAGVSVGTLADRYGLSRLIRTTAWMLGPLVAVYWLSPGFEVALVSLCLLGATYLAQTTAANGGCQARSPPHLRARVMGVFSAVIGGSYAAGVALQGWLADGVGLRAVGVGCAVLYGGLVWLGHRGGRRPLDRLEARAPDWPATPDIP